MNMKIHRGLLLMGATLPIVAAAYQATVRADTRFNLTQLRAISTAVGAYASACDINDLGVVVGGDVVVPTSGTPRPYDYNALKWDVSGAPAAVAVPERMGSAWTLGAQLTSINN